MTSDNTQPGDFWRAFGRNLAAGFGAFSALLSLLAGSSVSTACLRGALALFGILFVTRLGSAALRGIASFEQRYPGSARAAGDLMTDEKH